MARLTAAVSGMLTQFRAAASVDAVQAYLVGLADIDPDLIERTVSRYCRGVVPGHDNRFAPNVPQLRAETERFENQFASGRPERVALPAPKVEPRTDAEREKADAILRAAGFGPKNAHAKPGEESEEERKRRAEQMRRDEVARAANRARIAQEWADRGEEPVYADDARTMIVSPTLAAMLRAQA
ncbi:MAG: hypothetical protein IT538_09010 [Variibacter sp.]|nr:hypothetical protein [Variibacter sp.]